MPPAAVYVAAALVKLVVLDNGFPDHTLESLRELVKIPGSGPNPRPNEWESLGWAQVSGCFQSSPDWFACATRIEKHQLRTPFRPQLKDDLNSGLTRQMRMGIPADMVAIQSLGDSGSLSAPSQCPQHTHTHTHTTPSPHHTHTPMRLNTWCSHFYILLDGSCWSLFSGNSAVSMHSYSLPLLLVQRDGALHWAL